jgi:hypothetical protein
MHEAEIHAVTTVRQFGGARRLDPPTNVQPLVWQGEAQSAISLGPGSMNAIIQCSDGVTHGGVWSGHAVFWTSSPGSGIDLHPNGWALSEVLAIAGPTQVGWTRVTTTSQQSAALWRGSAASFVNMNPTGSISSSLRAAIGNLQAGSAAFPGTGGRAGIWQGTASSYANIHPAGAWTHSWINGMTETQQVGAARVYPQWPHAAIWQGTAASFTDIDPPESFGYSELLATCGSAQVGYIAPASGVYAGIWYGTAQSFHNLGQYLPPGYGYSRATSIATDGFFYYVGGYAENGFTLDNEAFLWIGPVPGVCYANCDQSTTAPALNVSDFTCFLQRFAAGEPAANCDRSTTPPTLNVADFTCFLQRFAVGCP